MDITPKFNRKSLSLSRRLSNRSNSSPKSSLNYKICGETNSVPKSPSVISISSEICDEGQGTPPNRKINFDSDYSPLYDYSSSPSGIYSQTTLCDTLDVSWRWNKNSTTERSSIERINTDTERIQKTRIEKKAQFNFNRRKEQRRKETELKLVDVEKTIKQFENDKKLNLKLNDNYCKPQKIEAAEKVSHSVKATSVINSSHPQKSTRSTFKQQTACINSNISSPVESSGYASNNNLDNFADLLNDSELDCILVEASQQVESKLNENISMKKSEILKTTFVNAPITRSAKKERYSSLKDIWNDSEDDLFASVDAKLFNSQESKTPKKSLQRYKSLPTSTETSNSSSSLNNNSKTRSKLQSRINSTKKVAKK